MIDPNEERVLTEFARLDVEVILNRTKLGPDAARKIAQRIEDQGGFWGPRKTENPA